MTLLISPSTRRIAKAFLFFFALSAMIFLIHFLDIQAFDEAAIDARIRSNGLRGIILYIAITAIGSSMGVPRQALSFLGGYAFGAIAGTIYATLGTTLGCACAFFFARFFARKLISKKFATPMKRLDAFLSRAPFTMTLVVRFLPVGNNALTTLLAGVSSIPGRWFIIGSFLGYIPQTLIFSLLGSGIRVDPFWRVTTSAILFVIATLIGYLLYRRHKIRQALEGEEGPDETPSPYDEQKH